MIYPINNRKSGFTLIELIIVLAIMGILTTLVFSMFSFNNNIFFSANKQYNIQNDVRLGIDTISEKLRFATSLTITDVSTSEAEIASHQPYNYIYVKASTIKIAIYNETTHLHSIQTLGGSGIISDIGTSFTKVDDSTLGIALLGVDGTKNYQVSSNISLKNFAIIKPTPVIEGNISGLAVKYSESIPSSIAISAPYTDLVNFEKNMFNIVGTNAGISFGTNNVLNTQSGSSILMQGTDLTLNGLGNNLNGNIAVKANNLNLGAGQTGTSNGECIFDVNAFSGSLSSYNSTFYVHDAFENSSKHYNKIESYNGTFWSYLFANKGDSRTTDMIVRTLKSSIDFNDYSINPTLNISKIHYVSGTSPNTITDNKLPDYKGNMSTVANVNSASYEYIICHGPLLINTTDANNGKFNFRGIIYCDDVVTLNDMGSDGFNGIIIAKGLKALNVIGSQTHNWNVSFNNNANNLTEFNAIMEKITTN